MLTSSLRKTALCLGFLAALAGCAQPTPYVPRAQGQATGYTDRELAPGRWRVTFTGNAVTPRDTVEDFLLLRAAEVTLANGGTHFMFDTRDTRSQTRYYADPPQPGGLYGGYGGGFWGGYWGFTPRWGYSAFGPPLMISSTTRFQAFAEIVILRPGQEKTENRAVDARAVVTNLRPAPPA
jgi:hypothetical protein